MWIDTERPRPEPWHEFGATAHVYFVPLLFVEWCLGWAAHLLSKWAFLEVLEYAGRLSVLIAVIFYFLGGSDRLKQKHYQAWQVINTAQGKSGNGGRIDALQELNSDGVSLVAVDLSHAALPGVRLDSADLLRAAFDNTDLRGASFRKANLWLAEFTSANLEQDDLSGANLRSATFGPFDDAGAGLDIFQAGADLQNSKLNDCDLSDACLAGADLRFTDLSGVKWQHLHNIRLANVYGAKNFDSDFRNWALAHGAVEIQADSDWRRYCQTAKPTTSP